MKRFDRFFAIILSVAGLVTMSACSGKAQAGAKDPPVTPQAQSVSLKKDAENTMKIGQKCTVTLDGNPTTGYSWHYEIADTSVLTKTADQYHSDASPNLAGAGGVYTWDFKALQSGKTTITFKYYREWEGEQSATEQNTVIYQVNVTG